MINTPMQNIAFFHGAINEIFRWKVAIFFYNCSNITLIYLYNEHPLKSEKWGLQWQTLEFSFIMQT